MTADRERVRLAAWAAALAEVIAPGLAADLAPVRTLAPGSALAAP